MAGSILRENRSIAELEKWFVDEKRQMGFFVEKIKELVALQQDQEA